MSNKAKLISILALMLASQVINAQSIEIKKQDFIYPVNIPIEKIKVDSTNNVITNASKTTPVVIDWKIVQNDSTVYAAVQRWAGHAGYQIVWQAEKDLPAYAATYQGNFENAVESLMTDTKNSAYPLHACLYENKVIRILHVTQSCGQ